jgi:hypothetical protein
VRKRIISIISTILYTTLVLNAIGTKSVSASQIYSSEVNILVAENDESYSGANKLLTEALQDKNFYRYNMAYAAIMKISDENVRDSMLSKLSAIQKDVWTEDIKKFNNMLDELVNTNGSGKIYDEIYASVQASSLVDLDKGYLLGELDSWGRKLVYTTDYSEAVSKVVRAWEVLDKGSKEQLQVAVLEADKAIVLVKNAYSKAYLTLEINKIKEKNGFTVVNIT